jgi:hypothetical protein
MIDDLEEVESFEEENFAAAAEPEELVEEVEEESVEEEAEEAAPKKKRGLVIRQKPKANVYTMMMILSLIAIGVACFCLNAEMNEYRWDMKAKTVKMM